MTARVSGVRAARTNARHRRCPVRTAYGAAPVRRANQAAWPPSTAMAVPVM